MIIVLNKRQKHEWKIDQPGLMRRFGEIIREVKTVDLSRPQEIPALQKSVKYWLSSLPMIGDKLPKNWVEIRERLSQDDRKFITYGDFQGICREFGIDDIKDVEVLSRYYDMIGVITHFIDDPVLQERVYIDSNWLVKTVYHLLDDEDVKQQDGRLTKSQIAKIWKDNEVYKEVDKLVGLMLRFALLFKVRDKDEYIVPEHLKEAAPYKQWPYESEEMLEFHYELGKYMPKGLMARLIVELHHHIHDYEKVWCRGVNVEHDGAKAEVVEIYGQENKFVIRVTGELRRDLLVIIREHFERILGNFKNLNPGKLVPCNCEKCAKSSDPNFHSWDQLQNLLNGGVKSLPCGKSVSSHGEKITYADIEKLLGQYGKVKKEEQDQSQKRGGDTFEFYGGRHKIFKNETGDIIEAETVATRNSKIKQTSVSVVPAITGKSFVSSIVWRAGGSFITVCCVTLAVLYVPAWKVKVALIAGAGAALLSIIFNPKTWHRRAALTLLMLMGAVQVSFELYGRFYLSPENRGWGTITLSGSAVIVQVLIVIAAIAIYIVGERFSTRNDQNPLPSRAKKCRVLSVKGKR